MPAKIELHPETVSSIRALRDAGLTIQQVADAVHLGYATVYRVLEPEASETYRLREKARRRGSQGRAADLQQRLEELSARLDRVEALLGQSAARLKSD